MAYLDLAGLRAMLAELGVPVTCGLDATKGLMDKVTEPVLAGGHPSPIQAKRYTLAFETGSMASIAVGATVTVATTDFTVVELGTKADGAVTVALLQRVT